MDFIVFIESCCSSLMVLPPVEEISSTIIPDGAPAFFIYSLYATFSEKPSWLSPTVSRPLLLCYHLYFTYIYKLYTNMCLFSQNVP